MKKSPPVATEHQTTQITQYKVWDLPIRLFHWINFLLVSILLFLGLIMMFKPELGISGIEAKIGLKKAHVIIGYLFVINLLLRIIWGVIGGKYAKFNAVFSKFFSVSDIVNYRKKLSQKVPPQYLGHNPLGKKLLVLMFLTLFLVAITGLIRAGTDIYYPPFGHSIKTIIAQPDFNPDHIKPYDKTGVDKAKLAKIKPIKKLAGKLHTFGSWLLLLLIVLHIAGAIYTECKHQNGIISAMFSGKKPIHGKPEDL